MVCMPYSARWAPAWREQSGLGPRRGLPGAPGAGLRGRGLRPLGGRQGARGAQLTEQARQSPDVLDALRHLSRRRSQLSDTFELRD
eukprot:4040927-Pyramimonas_sp.AAC.1